MAAINESLERIGADAKKAASVVGLLCADEKNRALEACADELKADSGVILEANAKDMDAARKNGLKGAFLERLTLNEKRLSQMASGLREIAALPDPVGEISSMKPAKNGLLIGKMATPIGVIGVIYESRPNVTSDAFGLCFKAGSGVILRGGSEAVCSNEAITAAFQRVLARIGLPPCAVSLLADTSRETAAQFMRLDKYVDVLIPRGGAGLIRAVVENSTIPVIETGVGNCHIYVDESADIAMAIDIIVNAKTDRPGVCNACEKVLIHEAVVEGVLPALAGRLFSAGVEIRGDGRLAGLVPEIKPAEESDWDEEYLDLIIAMRAVKDIGEAIGHINARSTKHSESIITGSYDNAQRFLREVDSAAVYVNASTRFTDGNEFGLGAEIGISTQKLHARGPIGLRELVSEKYVIYGSGQLRNA